MVMNAEEIYNLSERLYQNKEYPEALEFINRAIEAGGNPYWCLFLKGKISSELGLESLADESYNAAIATDASANIGAMFELAKSKYFRGHYDCSEDLIDRAIERAESSDQKRWYFGSILLLKSILCFFSGKINHADKFLVDAYDFRRDVNFEELRSEYLIEELERNKNTYSESCFVQYIFSLEEMRRNNIAYVKELSKVPSHSVVVEIGAMDGIRFDMLHDFILEKKCKAILVEPVKEMFELLVENYKGIPGVVFVNKAISEERGSRVIRRIPSSAVESGKIPDWALGLSSFSSDGSLKFYEDMLVEETVDCITFDDLCIDNDINEIHVIQIDTEGHDAIIFSQIDLGKWNPLVVHLEFGNLRIVERIDIYRKFTSYGYSCGFDGADITAIKF